MRDLHNKELFYGYEPCKTGSRTSYRTSYRHHFTYIYDFQVQRSREESDIPVVLYFTFSVVLIFEAHPSFCVNMSYRLVIYERSSELLSC